MSAKAALLSLVMLMPGVLHAEPLSKMGTEAFLDTDTETGHIVWSPSADGKTRFSYLLPETGIREAVKFEDTSSLYYLSQVKEAPITGRVTTAPLGLIELSKDEIRVSTDWFVTPTLSFGFGALREDRTTKPILNLKWILAPSTTALTTVSIDAIAQTRIHFDRARLHINENSETLFYAALSDDEGVSLSVSYGRRFWDTFLGADLAWAAGFEQDREFAGVQVERDFGRIEGALRVTLKEHGTLEVGVGFQIALGKHHRLGDWTSRVVSGAQSETVLDRPSLSKYRRDYMAKRWRQEVTIGRLRQVQ